ncbi:MAG: PAS domain S-box protein [bacterium]|nr:PAS domain S-box protein [bacterium]
MADQRKAKEQLTHNLNGVQDRAAELETSQAARRRAQEQVRLLTRILEQMNPAMILADEESHILYANPAFTAVCGYAADEVLGKPSSILFGGSEEDLAAWGRQAAGRVACRGEFTLVCKNRRKDGSLFWASNTFTPFSLGDDMDPCWLGVLRDITEQKQLEDEARTFSRLATRLAACSSLDSIKTAVREEIEHLFECDAFYFATRRPEDDTFHFDCYVDTVEGRRRTFPREEWEALTVSPQMRRALEGHPVLLNRMPGDAEPRLSRFGDADRASASLMTVPVRVGKTIFGIISAQSYTYGRYDEIDLDTFQRIADTIGPSLKRVYAEEAVRESERRYRLLAENATDLLWTTDMNLRLTYISPSVTRIRGYAVDEAMSLRLDQIMTPRSYELAMKTLKEELAAEQTSRRPEGWSRTLELEHICKDGSTMWSEAKMTFLRDQDGQPIGILGVTRDITERKHAEAKEQQYIRGLKFLSNTAMGFVQLAPQEDIYSYIAHRIKEVIGNPIVLVNSYDPESDTICMRAVLGLGKNARKVLKALGRDPLGMTLKMNEQARKALASGKFHKVPGGIYELAFKRIPKPACRFLESLLGLGGIYSMGLFREGQLFGDVCIMCRKGNEIVNPDIVETFINQGAIALRRKQIEEGLAKERNLLRTLIDNIPDCHIFVKDTESRFITTNIAHLNTLGAKSLEEVVGKTDTAFFAAELAERYYADDQRVILSGQPLLDREELVIDRHDRQRWFLTTKVPLRDWRGAVTGLIGISRDITARKLAEKEKERLQEQLAHAQKMEALGTLAGGIAHEYNNIVAAIIGYVDLTLQTEKELSETARGNLDVVRSSGTRAADLTKSLLSFSRKEIGKKEPVSLRDVVDRVLKVTASEFTSEGIEVTVNHSTNVPLVMANAPMLESVAMNLVVNARHAMLNSEVKKLTVQTGLENGKPFIRVEDTGCGIPEKDLVRIFDPFFTTKGALVSGKVFDGKARGTGLGLSVSHSIIEAHGGEIKVRSQLTRGTTFTVYLPAASRRKTTRQESEEKRKEAGPRIMVVDDEEPITDLIVDILGHAGYEADGFTSPQEAAKALRQEQYALAFVDLQMPDMNGEDFIKDVNSLPAPSRPLTVILTGRLDVFGKDYSGLNVFSILPKPFDTQQLLDIARKALTARTPPPETQETPRETPPTEIDRQE